MVTGGQGEGPAAEREEAQLPCHWRAGVGTRPTPVKSLAAPDQGIAPRDTTGCWLAAKRGGSPATPVCEPLRR